MVQIPKQKLGSGSTLSVFLVWGVVIGCPVAHAQKVNKDAQTLADFQARAAEYVKVQDKTHKNNTTTKNNGSAEAVSGHEKQLAGRIRSLRPAA